LNIPDSSLPKPHRRLPFLVVLGLFGLGLGFLFNTLDPFIYAEKVRLLAPPELKNTALSSITIMALLVALVAQPLVGRWSDRTRSRWGKRAPYLVVGVGGLSITLILIVVSANFWLLIGAAMLLAAFSNTMQAAWQALLPDLVPETQRGRAAGVKTLLEIIGVVVGVTLVSASLSRGYLWTAPLVALGLFGIILLVTLYTLAKWAQPESEREDLDAENAVSGQFMGQTPRWPGLIGSLREIWVSAQAAFKNWSLAPVRFADLVLTNLRLANTVPGFNWWVVNRVLFWSAAIAARTFMLNYMQDVLGLLPGEAQHLSSQLVLVLGAGIFLLALPAGMIADRVGRRPLLVVAGLLASTGAVGFMVWRDLPLLFVAGGLMALGAGLFTSSSWALATDLSPQADAALYLGLANSATVVGSITGRLAGPLIDGVNHLTGTVSGGYLAVFSLAALGFVASSAAVLKIPRK
jgi:MFS family permease